MEAREIKLRARDTVNNCWVEAVTYTLHTSGRLLIKPPGVELTEWIGRADENGVDIYERDIVAHYRNTIRGWVKEIDVIGDIRHLPDFSCSKQLVVIGNTYDNPSLIPEE